MSRSKKSIKNIVTAIIGQGIGLVVSFIARLIFIKILGAEYLGLNGLFTNILTVLSLAELGIGEAINFSLYKPLAEKDELKCEMLMQLYKKTYTIIGIAVLICGVLVTPFLHLFISDMPDINNINLIYILFVVNISISYFFSYKRNLIIADQNRYIATIYRYGFYILLNIVQILYLIYTKNYIGYLILQIIFTFLENVFVSLKANKMYPFLKDKKKVLLDKETKSGIIKNTKAMLMHKTGEVIVNSTDNILLSSFVGLTAVGLYSNYYMIIKALNTVFGQVFNAITASVGNLVATENKEKSFQIFNEAYFTNFCIYSFASICFICLSNPFIELWLGKEYLLDFNIVLILTINFYITGMRKSVLTFRDAAGLFYADRWKSVVEGIVNLIVSLLLVNKLGIFGVFLGTFISSASVCVWIEPYVLYKKQFEKNIKEYFTIYFKYLLFTIGVGIVTYLICNMIDLGSLLSLILKALVCITVILTMLIVFFRQSKEFDSLYNKLFRNRKKSKLKEE